MKKFLLVNLPTSRNAYHNLRKFVATNPPMGLAAIGAVLERDGIEASILDADALNLTLEETRDKVVAAQPDYVGSTTMTATMGITYDWYAMLKEKMPDIVTMVGGPHASALPKQTLEESKDINIVVIGEGDITVTELMHVLQKGGDLTSVDGIAFREKGSARIIETARRPMIDNMYLIPSPAYHLLDFNLYESYGWNNWVSGHRRPLGIIFTARGCVGKCNFCATRHVFGHGVRHHPLRRIKDEIDLLINKYKIRILYFLDDTFTANRKVVNEICDYLIEKGYNQKIEIMCSSRCDTVHLPTLQNMRKAGFRWICFGVESGNQKILDAMHKNIKLENIYKSHELAHKAGLFIVSNYMIGHIGETYETAMDTINLCCSLKQEYVSFAIAIPLPGTELYDYAIAKGIKLPIWNNFGSVNTPPIPLNDSLDAHELMKLRTLATDKFFKRPLYILHMLCTLKPIAVIKDFVSMYIALRREYKAGRL